MTFYVYSIYAREIFWNYRDMMGYREWQGETLHDEDTMIIPIYLHLHPMNIFCLLDDILQKNPKQYKFMYKKQFRIIKDNRDDATHIKKFIFHKDLGKLFERKKTKIFLYNTWETRNLYRCFRVLRHFCDFHGIPRHKLYFSMTDHKHIGIKTPYPRIISFDWQYIMATKKALDIDFKEHTKSKRVVFPSHRCNAERYRMAVFLYTYYREVCDISFLVSARSDPITSSFLSTVEKEEEEIFLSALPLRLSAGFKESIKAAHIMLTFETNIVRKGCQQISEKTYHAILAGIPFLLWGSQGGILLHLHSLGFKTFSPHINEEYDNHSKSYNERFALLQEEVARICSLNDEDFLSLMNKLNPIAKYNFTILQNTTNIPDIMKFLS